MVDSHTSKSSRIDRENRVQIAPVVVTEVVQAAEVTVQAVVARAVVVWAVVVTAVVTIRAAVMAIRAVVVQAVVVRAVVRAVVVQTVVEPLPLCMAVAVACANAPGFECCVKSDTARKSRKNRTSVNLPMARSTSLKNKKM